MEGHLTIPPDRGTILGRALWKTRYVVIGGPQRDSSQREDSSARSLREKPGSLAEQNMYLSIYKTKDDDDPVQQYPLTSISDCHVQMMAHRKQGPILPTLSISLSPDPATEKMRKRRSSRTAGLTSPKEAGPTTLWFRLAAEDQTYALTDWARYLQSIVQPVIPDRHPISPISPTSPSFINPFSPTTRSSIHGRHGGSARPVHTSYSSESQSLRSRRSDLSSSHTSLHLQSTAGHSSNQEYTGIYPSDMPSPAMTVSDYPEEFIEGWTSAQGRSSALGSPIRGRGGSLGLSKATAPFGTDSNSPPGPRETILDRAFSMRYIPGAETAAVPGEEQLSSLARFEALMRDAEQRRETPLQVAAKVKETQRRIWVDEESDADSMAGDQTLEDDSDGDNFAHDTDHLPVFNPIMPPARTPGYTNHRHSMTQPIYSTSRSSFHEAQLTDASSILRPQTVQPKNKAQLTPQNSTRPPTPGSPLNTANSLAPRLPEDKSPLPLSENRNSVSSAKRLSLNDFSKRLSSSSSLLIVQTNASGGSNNSQADYELEQQSTTPRTGMAPRAAFVETDGNSGWRGSHVFGNNEGGFL